MRTLLGVLRLITMVLWVGGLAFFAFILAPLAFHTLASTHEAGVVVGGTLRVLHRMGMVCGVVFFLATAVMLLRAVVPRAKHRLAWQIVLVVLMLLGTAYSQFHILPAMERDRMQAGGEIERTPQTNAGWIDFNRLHNLSEKVEGFVFFCGVCVVFLLGRELVAVETVES